MTRTVIKISSYYKYSYGIFLEDGGRGAGYSTKPWNLVSTTIKSRMLRIPTAAFYRICRAFLSSLIINSP